MHGFWHWTGDDWTLIFYMPSFWGWTWLDAFLNEKTASSIFLKTNGVSSPSPTIHPIARAWCRCQHRDLPPWRVFESLLVSPDHIASVYHKKDHKEDHKEDQNEDHKTRVHKKHTHHTVSMTLTTQRLANIQAQHFINFQSLERIGPVHLEACSNGWCPSAFLFHSIALSGIFQLQSRNRHASTATQWAGFAQQPHKCNENKLFFLFLGSSSSTVEYERTASSEILDD